MKITVTNESKENQSLDSAKNVDLYSKEGFQLVADLWMRAAAHQRLMYEPTWLGIPIVQFPTDIVCMQEMIWKIRPDFIVETGVAHGGSCVLHASILEMLGKGQVIGVDVEIRKYNEIAIKSHPLSKRIRLIEGSSVAPETVAKVNQMIPKGSRVIVVLDSNHSYEHVKKEIQLYKDLVSAGSYLVVMDGAQEWAADLPNGKSEWRTDNPLMAIREFMEGNQDWEIDEYYSRMKITSSPQGFLRRKDSAL